MAFARFAFLAALITTLCGSLCLAKDKSSGAEGSELLSNAASLQNIREQGAQPFQLRIRIHAEHIVSKPLDGSYAEIWVTPSEWRREMVFPGFTQLEIGDVDSMWLTRNLDFRPRVVYLATAAIEAFVRPGPLPDEMVKSVRKKKSKGLELRCVELVRQPDKPSREACFDASGTLVVETHLDQRFEYGDFSKVGTKIFPKSISVYESDRRVLGINVDDLSLAGEVQPAMFHHELDAHRMSSCERWPAEPVKKVPPQYPEDARRSGQQGTVTLYALLSGDGLVERTTVLESVGASVDRSATDAVKQWVYAPTACGPTQFESEIEVRVNYSLRQF